MSGRAFILCLLFWTVATSGWCEAERATLRVATYNLRNYLSMDRWVDGGWRPEYPKPESEKRVVRKTIHSVAPDVLVVQEIGDAAHLAELQADLASEGLALGGSTVAESAADPERRLGALWSGDLEVTVLEHADLWIDYLGERQRVKRGMLELRIAGILSGGEISVFSLHLKSKYTDDPRDPKSEERRTLEARAARDRILELYPNPRDACYLVLGDLNDAPNSPALRGLTRRGEVAVAQPLQCQDERGATWTHFYKKGGMYSQVDYILISPGWPLPEGFAGGRIESPIEFFEGSDHRLVWVNLPLLEDSSDGD